MRYTTLLLTLLLSFYALQSSGQRLNTTIRQDYAEVNWGPEEKATRGQNLFRVLGHTDDAYYALIDRKKLTRWDYSIRKFNKEMELIEEAEINLEHHSEKLALVEVIMVGGRIWQFDAYRNRSDNKVYLFAMELDGRTLRPASKRTKVASYSGGRVPSLIPIETESTKDESIIIEYSENQAYIAIQTNSRSKKKEQETSTVTLFDKDMQELWSSKVKLPSTERRFVMKELDVDNNGNAYLLGRRFNEGAGRRVKMLDGKPNYDYRILKVTSAEANNADFELDLGEKFITDLTLSISKDNILNCAGFYSEKGVDQIAGTCFMSLNSENGNASIRNTKKFSLEFIMQNESARRQEKIKKREAKGKDNELDEIDLREIISIEGGGSYIIGEERYVTTYTYTTPNGNMRTVTQYHYNDLIVVRLSPEGIIEWAQKIPKSQTGGIIPFYFSYSTALIGEDLYIIYNDAEENLVQRETDKPKTYSTDLGKKDNVVTIAKVSATGIERKLLFRRAETEVLLRAPLSKQINENSVLVFGELKKSHRFGLLSFK